MATPAQQLALIDPPLMVRTPGRRYRLASDQEILDAARAILSRQFARGAELTSPEATRDYLKIQLAHLPYEVFAVLFLDNRHRVITFTKMFRGTIDGASVHAREVVRECLEHRAAAIILAHNHPSGVGEPSQADLRITQRLKDALALIDVRILDHLIVGEGPATSLAERGLI